MDDTFDQNNLASLNEVAKLSKNSWKWLLVGKKGKKKKPKKNLFRLITLQGASKTGNKFSNILFGILWLLPWKQASLFPRHASVAFLIPLVKLFPLMYFVRSGLSFLFQNTIRPDLPFLFHNIINTGVHIFMLLGISLMDYRWDVIKNPNIFFDIVTNSN